MGQAYIGYHQSVLWNTAGFRKSNLTLINTIWQTFQDVGSLTHTSTLYIPLKGLARQASYNIISASGFF